MTIYSLPFNALPPMSRSTSMYWMTAAIGMFSFAHFTVSPLRKLIISKTLQSLAYRSNTLLLNLQRLGPCTPVTTIFQSACSMYILLSHLENDCDVTERAQGYMLQGTSFMRQSRCFFLNAWGNTQVAHAVTSVFPRNTRWRHGRSRDETKYSLLHLALCSDVSAEINHIYAQILVFALDSINTPTHKGDS